MNHPVSTLTAPTVPALVATAGERAGMRFLEFFAANIRNPHTRRAYARAADEFLAWCASAGVPSIGAPCCIGASGGAGGLGVTKTPYDPRSAEISALAEEIRGALLGFEPRLERQESSADP